MSEPTTEELRGATGIGPGDVIAGKYLIEAALGAGGMGVVFRARHTKLDGHVALKFLSRECLANPQAVSRFQREAQAAARLKNDHVVRVFDVGVHENGLPYIVMEHLEGGDLARLLRATGTLPPEQAVDLLLQACVAVAEAHDAGIIHRDLKPSNLFCVPRADGRFTIKIVDFGISKLAGALLADEESVTVTGNFIGSPSYMSPEQMHSASRVDERADIWSLGVVLYECLTGKLPFPAASYPEMCLKVTQAAPVPPRAHRPELPVALEHVILKCLEKAREQRYASVGELAEALREFAGGSSELPSAGLAAADAAGIFAHSSRPPRRASHLPSFSLTQPSWVRTDRPVSDRRLPLLAALTLFGACLLAVLVWVVFGSRRVERAAAPGLPSAIQVASPPVKTEEPQAVPTGPPLNPEPWPAVPAASEPVTAPEPVAAPTPVVSAQPVSPPSAPSAVGPPSPVESALAPRSRPASPVRPPAERDARSPTWTR